MNKAQAMQAFLDSYGVPAYDAGTVPESATYPRITYTGEFGYFGDSRTLQVSLWYKSTSWAGITAKAEQIGADIGEGGKLIPYEGGTIWIQRGVPFAQRMADPDRDIRRMVLMLGVEFL